jgi:hypothetical protein|tara:strand:- start:636 stop:740 length:105 start_codon:yes stop_codon:yes gene_type:complete
MVMAILKTNIIFTDLETGQVIVFKDIAIQNVENL